jgi:cyanophycinase-like exopeptidase
MLIRGPNSESHRIGDLHMAAGLRLILGSGAVYIVDGASVTRSNIAEGEDKRTLSMTDVKLHILSDGDHFDLNKRRPIGK